MKTLDAYGELLRFDRQIFTTREAATMLRRSSSSTTHALSAMEAAGLVQRLRRGLWALGLETDPFVVPPFLTAPFPAYVSLWSALSRHDMIEQIPGRISVASLGRARRIPTSIAEYEIHQISPELFRGFEGTEPTGYLAIPEKALFDTIYIRAAGVRAGGGARAYFPELSLPSDFDSSKLEEWTSLIASPRLRTLVDRGVGDAVHQASSNKA